MISHVSREEASGNDMFQVSRGYTTIISQRGSQTRPNEYGRGTGEVRERCERGSGEVLERFLRCPGLTVTFSKMLKSITFFCKPRGGGRGTEEVWERNRRGTGDIFQKSCDLGWY